MTKKCFKITQKGRFFVKYYKGQHLTTGWWFLLDYSLTSYGCHLWYTCLKWYLLGFKILIFGGCKWGKRADNGPKWQKILLWSISQEPHVNLMSRCFFYFLKKFYFPYCMGGKKSPKTSKNSVGRTLNFRNHNHMIFIYYTYMYKRIISPSIFSFFQTINFQDHVAGLLRG